MASGPYNQPDQTPEARRWQGPMATRPRPFTLSASRHGLAAIDRIDNGSLTLRLKKPPWGSKVADRDERPGIGERVRRALLAFDAFVDDLTFRIGETTRERYERFCIFMDRFHVSGWRKATVEVLSEGVTVGLAGLVALLALALPAFRETQDDDWLKRAELSVTFLDRYGNEVGRRGVRHNDTLPLELYPDYLIKATLATEDRRFFEHYGIDPAGLVRALTTNVRAGGVVQGGSTLTQQLAKNLFLTNERTLERKVKEAFLAIWLESRLSKSEILKLYLDRAYLGGGAFGVDAAAQFYFGKSARDVTLAEAAMLAGLFKAPARLSPSLNLPASRARANSVLDNLVEAGFMTEGQVFGARRNPATPVDRHADEIANYYLDYAFDDLKGIVAALGKSLPERVFVVRTALDPAMQTMTEEAVAHHLRQFGTEYEARQAAAVVMDIDGAMRAMVGGRDYGESQFNRATDAARQPGSAFKPIVYAAAFMNGYRGASVMADAPLCIGDWCPQNYSRSFSGQTTLHWALTKSINTIPVRLAEAIGRGKIVDVARRMGIASDLKITRSLPLGVAELNLTELTGAYAVLASGGLAVRPFAVLDIRNTAGTVVWRHDTPDRRPPQALLPAAVADVNLALVNVVENGTARRAHLDTIRAAGKTGTTQSYRDAWFIGFTGNFVAGVWFGNDDYTPTNKMTGGSLPAMTWQQIMANVHRGIEVRPIFGTGPAPGSAPAPVATTPTPLARAGALSQKGLQTLSRIEALLTAVDRGEVPRRTTPESSAPGALPPRAEAPAAGPARRF
jgi:penicillin-binding protein 1A